MDGTARRSLDVRPWHLLVVVVLAGFAAVTVIRAVAQGPGISPDSVSYALAAQRWVESGGLSRYDGSPLTVFPPGFPLVLGLLAKVGVPVSAAAVAVNVLSVAALVVGAFALATLLAGPAAGLFASALVAVSPSTLSVYIMMWSEPLFLVLVLVVQVFLVRMVLRARLSGPAVAAVIITTSLACTLRYLGVALLPAVWFAIWLTARSQGRVRSLLTATVVTVASSTGLVFVVARNLSLGASPFGTRSEGMRSIGEAIGLAVSAMGHWMAPVGPEVVRSVMGVAVVAVVIGALVIAIGRREMGPIVVVLFVVTYWMALLYGEVTSTIDPVNDRLASPAFASTASLGSYVLMRAWQAMGATGGEPRRGKPGGAQSPMIAISMVAVVLGLAGLAAASWLYSSTAGRSGVGYNKNVTKASELAAAVRDLPVDARVATNNLPLVCWVSDRCHLLQVPRLASSADAQSRGLQTLVDASTSDDGTVFIALFEESAPSMDAQGMADAGLDTDRIAVFSDGELLAVRR